LRSKRLSRPAVGRDSIRILGEPQRSLTIWLDAQSIFVEIGSFSEMAIDSMRSNESLIPAQNQRWRRA
jgi:hypothetical protein